MINKALEDFGRKKAIELFKGEHGKGLKAEIWICGFLKISTSKKTSCVDCGCDCYYDEKLKENFVQNHKKICMKCALENHKSKLSALEIEILEGALV